MINVEQQNKILEANALPFEEDRERERESSLIILFKLRGKPRAEFDRFSCAELTLDSRFFIVAHAHYVFMLRR